MTEPERLAPRMPPRPVPLPDLELVPDTMPDVDQSIAEMWLARWQASVPRRFWPAKVGDFAGSPPIAGHLHDWSCADEPGNLLMFGDVGVGKTHAAIAACRNHFATGASMIFTPVGEMLDRLDWRRSDSATWLEMCCTADLLVIDDLGTERTNEWTGERLYFVVNRRWLDGRPIVATTNLTPRGDGGLEEAIGPRSFSRLTGGATMLMMDGDDRRRDAKD